MSSTSTNKQPLLIDRPHHSFAVLGPTAALTTPGNFNNLSPGGLKPLLGASVNSDGALIDSISLIANEASTTAARVLIFLSTASTPVAASASNTVVVAHAVIASSVVGERTNVPLPLVLTPVPSVGVPASPTPTQQKNTALVIPAGYSLYCGLSIPILLPSPSSTVTVFAQGGLY